MPKTGWSPRRRGALAPQADVWLLAGVALATAVFLWVAYVTPLARLPGTGVHLPWWILAGLFYLTEARVVHLHIGRSAHSFSMSEIPVVYGIFFFSATSRRRPKTTGETTAPRVSTGPPSSFASPCSFLSIFG